MTNIFIVGAGPTGLTLALELRRLGLDCEIVDKAEAGANTSRAAVVHARTLEVLSPSGVAGDLLAYGLKVPTFRVRDRDRALLTVDFGHIPSPFAFALMCPQNVTERILLERLESLGGSVARGVQLLDCAHAGAGVDARVRLPDVDRSVRARWLIGCDGMHSQVRKFAGIDFEGGDYQQSFVLADVKMDWPIPRDEVSLFFAPSGLLVVGPLPEDRFRVVATVDDAPEQPSASYVQALLDERGPSRHRGRVLDTLWSGRFHVHHRLAKRFRSGGVLLCGDAAHVHSPAGGQGMNTGIQDAVALAAALRRAVDEGDEAAIDAWEQDRREVAGKIVALTDRMTRAATIESASGRMLRNAILSIAGEFAPVRDWVASTLAEVAGSRG